MITLDDIKQMPLDKRLYKHLCETYELGDKHNFQVHRFRIESGDPTYIRWEIEDMTYDGNNPRDNELMLKRARCYIEDKVYTDEEWNKYFISAINEAIVYNNNFERWFPGYLIKEKETGKLAIVEYDYATGFEGRNFTDLAICELDDNGNIDYSWAWANYYEYELVDNNHTKENISKIKKYHKKYRDQVPYYLSSEMENLYYH